MKKLEELIFDNSYARLGDAYFSRVLPTPAQAPYLVAFNADAARLLDLDPAQAERSEFLQYFGGVRNLSGSDPLAMVYSGHQFGVRVPRLGDGRAILLGEVKGADGKRWDLHLKGSGETPYSRQGDGRAVLRSSIREYLCGEAMQGLGIPTTRTLCVIGSKEMVFRETVESRALIVRMAPSHVRFGSFEYFYFRHHAEPEIQKVRLQLLADYVIHEHFPEIESAHEAGPERYGAWLKEVSLRTARLIAQWQAVGWAHGVMNTDNMSILGLTLDYGPFGFMDDFDPGFIPNHSDDSGRYAFGQQPAVGLWNLQVLAQAVLPLMNEPLAINALQAYEPEFHRNLGNLLRSKLGLRQERDGEDQVVLSGLFAVMHATKADYTATFRSLGRFRLAGVESREEWKSWSALYRSRLEADGWRADQDEVRENQMNSVNPKFILRNYLAQEAIDEANQKGTYTRLELLLNLLRDPYSEHLAFEDYARLPPDWGKSLVVSCSS